jgi:uncharacterized repeat protein (TIGR04076 family)
MRYNGSEKMSTPKVKITVLKRVDPSVIFDGDVPNVPGTDRRFEACPAFGDDQEFVVENGRKPEGFCIWAWNDLFKSVSVLYFGGNFPWAEEGKVIACCTDGIRPVSFRLERVD